MARHGPRLKLKQKGKLGQKNQIFLLVHARVREERNKRVKSFSLRSTRFRRLEFVRSRTKVHRIDESYVWVPKTRDFAADSSKEFGKLKVSSLGSIHKAS